GEVEHVAWPAAPRSALHAVVFAFGLALAFARLVAELGGGLVVLVGHAFLEALDRLAQVATGAAQALGTEDQQHDHQDDDPMPDAEAAHTALPGCVRALRIPIRR